MTDSLKVIDKNIYSEILTALEEQTEAERGESYMTDMQSPSSVLAAAARAATNVIMAFERGYRLAKSV